MTGKRNNCHGVTKYGDCMCGLDESLNPYNRENRISAMFNRLFAGAIIVLTILSIVAFTLN